MPITVNEHFGRPLKPALDLAAARQELADITDPVFWDVVARTYPYTLLPIENMYSLYEAVRYVGAQGIAGDLVECGVFMGGAIMIMAETILRLGHAVRNIYLYDTFQGFNPERMADDDITTYGGERIGTYRTAWNWRRQVAENLSLTGYPARHFIYVEGDVETTVQARRPWAIALLRLDTDTYHTTAAELAALYPRLVQGGVLILDDYGYGHGARRAVTEYFAQQPPPLLHRPHPLTRSGVKVEHTAPVAGPPYAATPWPTVIGVEDVAPSQAARAQVLAHYLDAPLPGDVAEADGLVFKGWVLGATQPVTAVQVVQGGRVLGQTPLMVERLDVAAVYPHAPDAARSGFDIRVPVPADADNLALDVQAAPVGGLPVTLSRVYLSRQMVSETPQGSQAHA